jgi:hypothetical protein
MFWENPKIFSEREKSLEIFLQKMKTNQNCAGKREKWDRWSVETVLHLGVTM